MSDESDDPATEDDDQSNQPGGADEGASETPGDADDAGGGPESGSDESSGGSDSSADDSPDGDPNGDGSPGQPGEGDGGEGGSEDEGEDEGEGGADPERVRALAEELAATREELSELESRVEEKTVHRDDVTAELKRYVRARQRRGHATGWGPYLVLLYGTAMSLGAFYYLGGWVVVAALLVVWLSTLGLFVVMLLANTLIGAGRKLGGAREFVGKLRR